MAWRNEPQKNSSKIGLVIQNKNIVMTKFHISSSNGMLNYSGLNKYFPLSFTVNFKYTPTKIPKNTSASKIPLKLFY